MKSKLIKAGIACAVVLTVGVGGVFGYKALFAKTTTASANNYITATARKMNLQINIQGTGSAYAAISKDITANNTGEIKGLSLNVGDVVNAGDKLFVADSEQLRENLTKAENNLEKQKLQLERMKTEDEIAMQNLAISDAEKAVTTARDNINKMTVKAPIGGTVVAVNSINGDTVQAGKAVLTIVDTSSIRIKVAVDELDISKVQKGQKATVKFDAIKDKAYEGTVQNVAITGTTSNNVTTYDVVVAVTDPTGIRLGMNGNVNILVESRENALVVPAEAVIDRNGTKYVMVPESAASSGTPGTSPPEGTNPQGTQTTQAGGTNRQPGTNTQRQRGSGQMPAAVSGGKLVQVKTGLENENYIEILEGISDGQQVLITVTQTTTTNQSNNRNNMGGFGNFGGGGAPTGTGRPQGAGNAGGQK